MTARMLMPPVVLAVLFSLSGCVAPEEPPKSEDKPADKAKTPTELIVGTWKRVNVTPPLNPLHPKTVEFAADGTCTYRLDDARHGFRVTNGTYSILGKEMTMNIDPDFPDRKIIIEEISNDKLTISAILSGNLMVEYYERVNGTIASR